MEEIIIAYAKSHRWDLALEVLRKARGDGDESVCYSIDHETGRTLLHLAVDYGDIGVLEELIELFLVLKTEQLANSIISHADHKGQTPIDFAASIGDRDILELLQEKIVARC